MIINDDVLVAVHVMGHKVTSPQGSSLNFETIGKETASLRAYTSDPAADYQVLLHVRENWDVEQQKKFSEELARMNSFYVSWFHHGLLGYKPGNWSRAALAVMES